MVRIAVNNLLINIFFRIVVDDDNHLSSLDDFIQPDGNTLGEGDISGEV